MMGALGHCEVEFSKDPKSGLEQRRGTDVSFNRLQQEKYNLESPKSENTSFYHN